MKIVARIHFAAALAMTSLVLSGCGGGGERPPVYPVSGTVAYNGKPVEGAQVSFMGEKASRAATGVTDAEGKFQLSTFGLNDGAIEGTHKISVIKRAADSGGKSPSEEEMLNDPSAMAQMAEQAEQEMNAKSLIPEQYSSAQTTPLSETVTADGENVFVIQLID